MVKTWGVLTDQNDDGRTILLFSFLNATVSMTSSLGGCCRFSFGTTERGGVEGGGS